MNKSSRSHLRLVTEADRMFYDGPITRLGLWYRYPSVNYKKIIRAFLLQAVLLRFVLFFGFER